MDALATSTTKDRILIGFDSFEEIALALAARIAPWLAPILPAYVVGRALYAHLDVWPIIAIAGAIGFEIVGIASAKNALRCWTWNKARTRKGDPAAPFGLSVVLALLYFAVGIGLSVALEMWPELAKIAPASFFVLAGQSYFVLAISANLTTWENDRRAEKGLRGVRSELTAEVEGLTSRVNELTSELTTLTSQVAAEEARLNELATREEQGQLTGQNGSIQLVKPDHPEQGRIDLRRSEVLTLKRRGLTNQDIADQLEVSLSTIKNDLRELNGQVKIG